MDTARIAALLEPFLRTPIQPAEEPCHFEPGSADERSIVLSPAQLQHISTYIDILLRWNSRINLTAVRDPAEIVTRHFGESLFAARHLFPPVSSVSSVLKDVAVAGGTEAPVARTAGGRAALQGRESAKETRASAPEGPVHTTLADLGSGAGFPGIPLKIWAPNIVLTLIESNHKKATFLREVARALTLTDINIHNARAESLAGTVFDTITIRAVERFEAILPTAASLIAPSGRLALLVGSGQQDQAQSTLPDLNWSTPVPIPQSHSRILLVGRAERP